MQPKRRICIFGSCFLAFYLKLRLFSRSNNIKRLNVIYKKIKNIKMSSFKSSENIQKKEGEPDRSVSDNQSSSMTLNELAMKARNTAISSISKEVIH